MKYLFNYKNYTALVEYKNKIYKGKIINTKDTITFYTKDFDNIEIVFKNAVEDYLDYMFLKYEDWIVM